MKRIYLIIAIPIILASVTKPQWPPEDPEGVPDSVYIVCGTPYLNGVSGKSEISFQLRYFSDNTGQNKPQAMGAVLFISGAKITSMDTTVARSFEGFGLSHFSILAVSKVYNPDPSDSPFVMVYGAVNFTGGVTGDSLYSNVIMSIEDTGTICIEIPPGMSPILEPYVQFVTEAAFLYKPKWSGPYCCPVAFAIPTLTQWGMFVFALLLLGVLTFYVLKYTRVKPANKPA